MSVDTIRVAKRQQAGTGTTQTVAIIGGAVAGTVMLLRLWEQFADEIRAGTMRVAMFDRAPEASPGLAWDGKIASEHQLSNTPAGRLRLSDAVRPTFHQWLAHSYPESFGRHENLASTYPPRRLFGEYVRSICTTLAKQPGLTIRMGLEAIDIEPSTAAERRTSNAHHGPEYEIVFRRIGTDRLVRYRAHWIVLCTGSVDQSGGMRFAHLAGRSGFVGSPWPATKLTTALRDAESVAVLGTGLTAVDVTRHISATFPALPIVMTSRRGRLHAVTRDLSRPEVAHQPRYELSVLTHERLASLPDRISLSRCLDLLKREIASSRTEARPRWDRLLSADANGVHELREHVRAHRAGSRCRWQLAIAAIEEVFPELWSRLSDEDRARWMASLERRVFQTYSNPMPIQSAEVLLQLIHAGRLSVRRGLHSVAAVPEGGFQLQFQNDEDGREATRHVSHCIDCTGLGFDVRRDSGPLMQQLLAAGLVQPHPYGGLNVDPETLRARVSGVAPAEHNIYVTGHNVRGARYLTSGIGFLIAMSQAVVADIADRLRRVRSPGPFAIGDAI